MKWKKILIALFILALITLVIAFWDKFIIREEFIISADYCEVNGDCVLAVNPYNCCVVPAALNKEVVEIDEDFIVYEEGVDYSGHEKRDDCSRIECSPIFLENYLLRCNENKCNIHVPLN
ncbi:MAG TPA: hypothetical protein VJH92_03795 [Candidatus Nanoarchaeia archaeon]|nr:hypothetical protein [Candidatus Nanoarchaeia archaeon]